MQNSILCQIILSILSVLSPLSKKIMKSQDLQKVVLSKWQKNETPTKIFNDLSGVISLSTIKRWIRRLKNHGSLNLVKSTGRPRSVRTKSLIQKVKSRFGRKRPLSVRKLANELSTSASSMHRVLLNDLKLKSYKKIVEPMLSEEHKHKRVQFATWIRNNFSKDDTMRFLFSDEKMFDMDGMCNSQNDRVWAVDRRTADGRGGVKLKRKFPQRVMVWLGVSSKGVTDMIILDKGTVDHERYIKEVLPVARKCGNKWFGHDWTFQQDGARAHTHHLTQQWCQDNFPHFIDKDHWPPNSPDFNPLDYSIWNEYVNQMHWNLVKSKKTLIAELKRAVKRIRPEVILGSCKAFTKRLDRVYKSGGDYCRD